MGDEIEIKFSSNPRWLGPVRALLEGFANQAGFGSRDSHEITVAVGEALTNVMRHSYKGDATKTVQLLCALRDGAMAVEIRDQGEPFDESKLVPQPPEELRPGGRGIYLIRSVMDEVEYCREGKANLVRMKKFLKKQPC